MSEVTEAGAAAEMNRRIESRETRELTKAMNYAMRQAALSTTNRLYRWPGGYWMTRPRLPQERGAFGIWTTTRTVRALLALDLLREVAAMSRGDPWICELTEKAIQLLETEPSP